MEAPRIAPILRGEGTWEDGRVTTVRASTKKTFKSDNIGLGTKIK